MPPPDKYKSTKTNLMHHGTDNLADLKIDNAKTRSQNTFASDLEDSAINGVFYISLIFILDATIVASYIHGRQEERSK